VSFRGEWLSHTYTASRGQSRGGNCALTSLEMPVRGAGITRPLSVRMEQSPLAQRWTPVTCPPCVQQEKGQPKGNRSPHLAARSPAEGFFHVNPPLIPAITRLRTKSKQGYKLPNMTPGVQQLCVCTHHTQHTTYQPTRLMYNMVQHVRTHTDCLFPFSFPKS
jgi:hypothetical protein